MKFRYKLKYFFTFIVFSSLIYLSGCGEKATVFPPEPPPTPNPYGNGNGKITFIRTQPIDGPFIIKEILSENVRVALWYSGLPPYWSRARSSIEQPPKLKSFHLISPSGNLQPGGV